MIKMLDIMAHPVGNILISAMLGLGLAALFKKVCNDGHCVVVKGPPFEDIKDKVFVFEDKCYQYSPKAASCSKSD